MITLYVVIIDASSSWSREIDEFLANDNSTFTTMYKMQKEFMYLGSFYCSTDRMKKRYGSKWFVDHQITLKDVQPYYFLHIHKNGGMSVVEELEVLWKDEYWCQSEASYISVINDKSIFP